MGATVVQRFALDYPQKIKALVLVASFASTGNTGIGELNSIVSRMEDPVDIGFVYEFQKSTAFKSVPSASMEIYVNESMKVPARVWKAVAQQAMNVDYLSELKGIDIPTLIVWGDKDLFCPKKDQEALAATFKGSVWLTYEGTGHAIHWEDPVRFAKDLIDFIYQTEENRVILCGIGLLDNYSATSFY
jgi:pimeloyl-ACP methyl ester carboxylesterase